MKPCQRSGRGGRIAYPHGVMPEPTAPDGVAIEAYDGENTPALIERLNSLIESGPFEVHVRRDVSAGRGQQGARGA